MRDYNVALFIHLIAVIGMTSGAVLLAVSMRAMSRAGDVSILRSWARVTSITDRLMPLFGLGILISGAYMVEKLWAWDQTWISVSLALLLAMFVAGPAINARKMRAIHTEAAAAPAGPTPRHLQDLVDDRLLATSSRVMDVATVGIIYLMVFKPGTTETLIAMTIVLALGVLSLAPTYTRSRRLAEPAESPSAASDAG